ncbi:DUF59 domain-containing protein [archaeon]|nr:MAG: DUF59 domain-containing protein [archaeon]
MPWRYSVRASVNTPPARPSCCLELQTHACSAGERCACSSHAHKVPTRRRAARTHGTTARHAELIRHLNDPEHPLTLEQLKVTSLENVVVDDDCSTVDIQFTPTIPHCTMATLIGLCIRVKLIRALPARFKVTVQVTPGTHSSEEAVNKQLNDKERVAAALENSHLLELVNKCIAKTDHIDDIIAQQF